MRTITLSEAMRAMEWAVTERGEGYVYPPGANCLYARDGEPDCLIGMALHRIGVPVETLAEMNDPGEIDNRPTLVRLAAGGFRLDADALIAMQAAQSCQDTEGTWGRAMTEAQEAVS